MDIKKDEIVPDSRNEKYTEFERKQYIVELNVGETFFCGVKDAQGKIFPLSEREFVAKYINCHFNLQWQDKGEKTISEI